MEHDPHLVVPRTTSCQVLPPQPSFTTQNCVNKMPDEEDQRDADKRRLGGMDNGFHDREKIRMCIGVEEEGEEVGIATRLPRARQCHQYSSSRM